MISEFDEIPLDTIFTVEYSIREVQIAVYHLLKFDRKITRVTPHDKSIQVRFAVFLKAFE
jgi:oleate hydratase